jgi:two-component system cell cycle sensor histidine kinase/response regulator CckA
MKNRVAHLERRLAAADATIAALLSGQIDAVVDATTQTPVLLVKAQEALRASEERYRRIVETTNQGVWMIDATSKTTFMNRRMAQMLGCEADMGIGHRPDEFLDQADRAKLAAHRDQPDPHQVEARFIRLDGTSVWTLLEIVPHFDGEGTYAGSLAMAMDISERKHAEAALVASEARFRRLWESGIILITISDVTGKIIEINEAGLVMLGYSRADLVGRLSWDDITPPESRHADSVARAQLATTKIASPWEKELIRKDGTRVSILAAAAILDGMEGIAIAVDMTASKSAEKANIELQEQLRQAQKMEAVGRLAGGIAHDFNNILTVILSCGEFLLDDLEPGSRLRADAEEITKAGRRAAELTRQLLMFSRRQVLEPKVLDLAQVTEALKSMLRRLVREDVKLVFRNERGLGRVLVDPGSIEQVLMNLVVNARDAMVMGGTLTIETTNETVEESSRDPRGRPSGDYVVLSVTDTGTGIDEATQARMFEPFFTTKEVGVGTGLGLSTVFGIVQVSNGSIHVRSALGAGTTLSISLPRVEAALDAELAEQGTSLRGTETILLVEDEDHVRAVTRAILERQGYRVIEMQSPAEALTWCRARSEQPIDLLITDVVMPQMGGPELARFIVKLYPSLRLLCMSGYTDNNVVRGGVLQPDLPYLQKPFTSESLTRKVREVLDSQRPHDVRDTPLPAIDISRSHH